MCASDQRFAPGQLERRIQAVSAEAMARGALLPIDTEREVLVDGGVAFQVRVAAGLRRKDTKRQADTDPFLPYDEALFVGHIGRGHVGLLNKFNVMDNHLLVVTRDFEDQRDLITRADFAALWGCLREVDGLGFYNGGEEAGASQPHKHLQLVVLPSADSGPRIPMEAALDLAPVSNGIAMSPALAFPHGLVRLDPKAMDRGADDESAPRDLHSRYIELLAHVGLPVPTGERRQPGPYNLLVTRRWMMLVPRAAERFSGVSLNALAFAGSLFVRERSQLETLRRVGPMHALGLVTGG